MKQKYSSLGQNTQNQGLGCGCSAGNSYEDDANLGAVSPSSMRYTIQAPLVNTAPGTVKYITYTNTPVSIQPPAVNRSNTFSDGLAYGYSWAQGVLRGGNYPAQWNATLDGFFNADGANLAIAATTERQAFVSGFTTGVQLLSDQFLGTSPGAPITGANGRTYTDRFLSDQATVAANNIFSNPRAAVLPMYSAVTTVAPMPVGTVSQMSTYDQFMRIAQSAINANLASVLSDSVRRMNPADPHEAILSGGDTYALVGVTRPFAGPYRSSIPTEEVFSKNAIYNGVYSARNPAAVWALFLMGNMGSSREAPRTLDESTYDAIQQWAGFQRWGTALPAASYLQAILNTPWVPVSSRRTSQVISPSLNAVNPASVVYTVTGPKVNSLSQPQAMVSNKAAAFQPPSASAPGYNDYRPLTFVPEGMAYGNAWARNLLEGGNRPAQWNAELGQVWLNVKDRNDIYGLSDRQAFVRGFVISAQDVVDKLTGGSRTPTVLNGKTITGQFFIDQATVAANNIFSQPRARVLPEVTYALAPTQNLPPQQPSAPGRQSSSTVSVTMPPTEAQYRRIAQNTQARRYAGVNYSLAANQFPLNRVQTQSARNWLYFMLVGRAAGPLQNVTSQDWADIRQALTGVPTNAQYGDILRVDWIPAPSSPRYYSGV